MLYYAVKVAMSAVIIVAISELAKRHSGAAALLAALPLTSLLAFVWLRLEGASDSAIASLSTQIFWLVIPSLALFVALGLLLRHGISFWLALGSSVALTMLAYLALLPLLRRFGVAI